MTDENPAHRANGKDSPSIDDFAIALIRGGYYHLTLGELAEKRLYHYAERLKAESDKRRGI